MRNSTATRGVIGFAVSAKGLHSSDGCPTGAENMYTKVQRGCRKSHVTDCRNKSAKLFAKAPPMPVLAPQIRCRYGASEGANVPTKKPTCRHPNNIGLRIRPFVGPMQYSAVPAPSRVQTRSLPDAAPLASARQALVAGRCAVNRRFLRTHLPHSAGAAGRDTCRLSSEG